MWANKKYVEMMMEVAKTRERKLYLLERYDDLLRNCPVRVEEVRDRDMFKEINNLTELSGESDG